MVIKSLNLILMGCFKVNANKERKILQEDLKELTMFQTALAESITGINKKISDVDLTLSKNYKAC
ncbi:hypothetical protein RhiirC2_796668 [Rhizophagus irregularis]|uniref:Uncharacterized protein n=1 Tax=Rhizophagus irregularis TaxID=588596 RepID=A0A2N1M998_9GLOM|nr:hypothetical protein RhiirC2_796668 [Rhizophagus irregularis]